MCVPVFTPFVDGLGPRDRRPFRMSEFRSFKTMFFRLAILTDLFSTVSDVQDKYFLKYHCFLSTAAMLYSFHVHFSFQAVYSSAPVDVRWMRIFQFKPDVYTSDSGPFRGAHGYNFTGLTISLIFFLESLPLLLNFHHNFTTAKASPRVTLKCQPQSSVATSIFNAPPDWLNHYPSTNTFLTRASNFVGNKKGKIMGY